MVMKTTITEPTIFALANMFSPQCLKALHNTSQPDLFTHTFTLQHVDCRAVDRTTDFTITGRANYVLSHSRVHVLDHVI